MDHAYHISRQDLLLRPLKREDIESLRRWRNDPAKTKFLRKIGEITPQMQEQWFEAYLTDPDILIFGIEETARLKRLIGSIAVYDFRDGSAEIGKLQIGDDEALGRGFGSLAVAAAAELGFQTLGLKKLTASAHPANAASHRCFTKNGFTVTGHHETPGIGTEDELELAAP